jgi:predicted unusual protein kinase regulating ubiquinone biosynthesis (AarF/ABC1/UbiB family)
MRDDDVRSRVAERIAAERVPLPTSALGRRAGWLAGLARAGAKSLGRTVRRTVGRDATDVEPEVELAASFGQLKGPMMKMGQVLGYVDVGLPAALRSALSALHTGAQPLATAWIHEVLDEDLGDPGRALAREMHAEALSAGSIGQVHRSRLPDGTPVVVKVLHPGLPAIIDRDFGVTMFASRISAPVHALVGHVRDRLLEECDYALEARRQIRFRAIFAGHPTLAIPAVHEPYSSARVLTTSFVEGLHIDRYLATRPPQAARNRVGEALFDFYIAPLFKHGLYNADPHPGNYLFLPDGRVAVVDFGCTREFAPGFVGHLAALTEAVMAADPERMHAALVDLGIDTRLAYDREATRRLLRAALGPLGHDEVLAFDVRSGLTLRDALTSAWKARRVALSGELLFLLRTFVGLSSVLARLGARANWRRRLETAVASAPAASAATPATSADTSSWDVVLVDGGESPIALIRELRELTGKDLRDLEMLIDSPPETLKRDLPRADAEDLRRRLEARGARVEVRRARARA